MLSFLYTFTEEAVTVTGNIKNYVVVSAGDTERLKIA